jgi:drug/metabolite transporter (DMT)-like permease
MQLGRTAKASLLGVAGALVAYGIILTVLPKVWTPFAAKFTMPKIGWAGVFMVAIVCDSIAAILAFFVLRRMKAPAAQEVAAVVPEAGTSPARA